MSSFRMRPCFSHDLDGPVEDERGRIVGSIEESGADCEVKSFPGFICLRVPMEERRIWSPRLNVSLEAAENGSTLAHGTYGPNANRWSMLLYIGLIVGSLGLFSGILGFCQWTLGIRPWGLWIFSTMVMAMLGMYLAAQVGQKLGAQQTFRLHQIYEAAVGKKVEIN